MIKIYKENYVVEDIKDIDDNFTKEEINEFISSIDYQPITDKIKEVLGVSVNLDIKRAEYKETPYIEITSEDLTNKCGILSNVIKKYRSKYDNETDVYVLGELYFNTSSLVLTINGRVELETPNMKYKLFSMQYRKGKWSFKEST